MLGVVNTLNPNLNATHKTADIHVIDDFPSQEILFEPLRLQHPVQHH